MDAREIFENVARTYANLKSLSVELRSITESGVDGSSNRSETRGKTWFEAPNKVRIEEGGTLGTTTVTDGVDVHSYHGHMKRYWKSAAIPGRFSPGVFRSDQQTLRGGLFPFPRIADQVVAAEMLAEESNFLNGSTER
jgi:outer membrane lipoprotein-sorting protein